MPEPDYNTYAVSSAPTSSPRPKSRPSGLGSRNKDADMYAGSSYAPTSNAGTSSATQTSSSSATSTGISTGAASNNSDDGPGYGQSYNPADMLYSNTATAMVDAGATLAPPTQVSYNPMNLYSNQSMTEIATEIDDYLRGTSVDDAMREALNIPEVYQGAQSEEEPEPNIDMDVLQNALQPEPITVEELPEVFMDGSYMFEDTDEELPDVIVKAGDTLKAIAKANGVPVQDVIDANPQIANPDMIRPGEVVKLSSRFDTKGQTPARELPEVLSIPEAAAYLGKERATLIMKGIDKLFGLLPPKTDIEKQAKSELEYFLDAQPESSLPDFFKYVPDKVQLAEYMKGRAERKNAAGVMNFSDRSALTNTDNLQLVDIEDETTSNLNAEVLEGPEALFSGSKQVLSSLTDTIKIGEEGNVVMNAQLRLAELGYDIGRGGKKGLTKNKLGKWSSLDNSELRGVDSDFGPSTQRAVMAFQKDAGIPVTGDIDPATAKALSEKEAISYRVPSGFTDNYSEKQKVNFKAAEDAAVNAGLEGAELAAYMAQVAHESDNFVTATEYASGSAYEGREDLGNTQPGDGKRFKGRGYIQLTGRGNYKKAGDALGLDLVNNPKLAEEPKNAAAISVWFWKSRVKPQVPDFMDTERVTKVVNGGFNGLDDRKKYFDKFTKKWSDAN